MTVLFLVVGIVVIIAVIGAVFVPFRHTDAVVSEFFWRRTLVIGTRVWVKRTSKRKPTGGEVRNVEVRNAEDPERRRYTYEERVWRKMRRVEESRHGQNGVRWPLHILGKDEEIKKRKELYKVTFRSAEGRRYIRKMRQFGEWQSLRKGTKYQLGRNALGAVRKINPAKADLAKQDL